jgi:two-component system OmpR family sensor kinase
LRISRFFYSIRTRIVLLYLVLLLCTFGIVSLFVSHIIGSYLVTQQVDEQSRLNEKVAVEIAAYLSNADANEIYGVCAQRGQEYNGRFLVLDTNGVVQVESFCRINGYQLRMREVEEVLRGERFASYGIHKVGENEFLEGDQEWAVYYTSAITSGSKLIGVMMFSASLQDVVGRMQTLEGRIFLLYMGAIVVAVLCGLIFSRYITKPIQSLTKASVAIADGHFDQRIKVKGESEISQLANSFNIMCEKLENLEMLRNEFVSNASHELKTPLSSIKVLVESLLYQDAPKQLREEFLQDINSEIDRLSVVVSDLLLLVHINQQDIKPHIQSESVAEILKKVLKILRPLAAKRNITIEFTPDEEAVVECDALKLQQALFNLIDNAVKYSYDGGSVRIRMGMETNAVRITILDNGQGIPQKDIPHIFDRFYRVDKARPRNTGGTGLGLSIVQKIVHMHGGRIEVMSTEEKGTAVVVWIPKVHKEVDTDA